MQGGALVLPVHSVGLAVEPQSRSPSKAPRSRGLVYVRPLHTNSVDLLQNRASRPPPGEPAHKSYGGKRRLKLHL